MEMKKRTYTEEFKRNSLDRLQQSGKTGADVARELGIGSGELNRWRRAAEKEQKGEKRAFPEKGVPRDEELTQLQRENRDLKEANEILKKPPPSSPGGRRSHCVPIYQ